jgi:UDP-N-acetylmuramate dehydrogenase
MHDITKFSGYRTETTCQRLYEPRCVAELCSITKALGENTFSLLAGGWNTVFSRSHYAETRFITTCNLDNEIKIDGVTIEAGCAALLSDVCKAASDSGLSGMENLVGIPSTIGGAVAMNAGAFGTEIADVLISVELVDVRFGEVYSTDVAGCRLYKRGCGITTNGQSIITKARFKLNFDSNASIKQRMLEVEAKRLQRYPTEPNCGSVFVSNHSLEPASRIIDQIGLKGFEYGGAKVSDKHAGFVVSSKCNVTGHDIVSLIGIVQRKLFVHTGNYYAIEQRIV